MRAAKGLVVAALLFAPLAQATKPCAPNPCTDPLAGETCDSAAAWIAIGKVTKVVHHKTMIQNHEYDFFDVDLVVDSWEKGSGPKVVHLVSRWCWVQPDLATAKGQVRVYGLDAATEKEVRYLFAEAPGAKAPPRPSATASIAPTASTAPTASIAPTASTPPIASTAPSSDPVPVASSAPSVPPPEPGPRGCGCTVVGAPNRAEIAWLALAALAVSMRRRARTP